MKNTHAGAKAHEYLCSLRHDLKSCPVTKRVQSCLVRCIDSVSPSTFALWAIRHPIAFINIFVYTGIRETSEFKRWLAKKGATFTPAKGSHFRVYLNHKQSILPMHAKEIKTGTVEGIKKQLGLK